MALFGEKYGDVVRMVEIGEGEYSRELCGGTHVRSTAEIGLFHITSETSSAANVRRIEALTGPAAVALLRERNRLLEEVAHALRARPDEAPEAVRAREQERRRLEKTLRKGALANGAAGQLDAAELAAASERIGGVAVVAAKVSVPDARALLEAIDRVKGKLGEDGVIVLGAGIEDRASLAVSVAPALVERGLRAGELVKVAAAVVGGGGGGRDTLAQAGGRDARKLDEAIAAARGAISSALGA
jgi:alanyl-tRNA synthetase